MPKEKLWFKKRRYGWGWTPITWQGWLAVGLYVVLAIIFTIILLPNSGEELGVVYVVAWGLIILSLTSFLLGISYRKGEPPKWQWGSDKIDSKDATKRRTVEEKAVPKAVRSTKKKGN